MSYGGQRMHVSKGEAMPTPVVGQVSCCNLRRLGISTVLTNLTGVIVFAPKPQF